MIRKRPGFAALCVAVLALGAGANSAVFSVVYATLLRPLAVPDLDRLVAIRNSDTRRPALGRPVTPADFLDWRQRSTSFQQISGYQLHHFDFSEKGAPPEGIHGAFITPELFSTLGV